MTNLIRMCIGDVTQYERIIRTEQKYRRDTNTESVRRRTVLSFFLSFKESLPEQFTEHLVKIRGVLQDWDPTGCNQKSASNQI